MLPALLCPLLLLAPLTLASPLPDTPHRPAHHRPAPPHHPAPQAYEDHGLVDGGAVLAARSELPLGPALVGVQVYLFALLVLGLLFTAYIFLIPIVFEPDLAELGSAEAGSSYTHYTQARALRTDRLAARVLASLETFENKIGLPEEKCQEEMVCEIRQLASRIPRVEALIQDYGLSMAGTRFQRALHVGGSGRNCANVIRSNRSTNSSTNSSSNSNSNSSNSSNSTLGLGNSSRDNSNSKSARCSSTLQTLVHIAKTYYGYA